MIELYERGPPHLLPACRAPYRLARGHRGGEIPSEGVEQVLAEYFGEVRLKDALTRILIISYEIQLRIPFFFRSERAKESADYDFPMRQVARATSAAPTYFEPAKVEAEDPVDYYALVDGGVFANNPAMCVYVVARRILEAEDSPDTDILVVSLGTGQFTDRLRYEEAAGWGLLGWARPIIDVVFDGVSDTVDFQISELLPPSRDFTGPQAPCGGHDPERLTQKS